MAYPNESAVIITPRETPFDYRICRVTFIVDNLAHEHSKFAETGLRSDNFESASHSEEVEKVSPLTIRQNRTVNKHDSGKQLDFDGGVVLVHKSGSTDFGVHVKVKSAEEGDNFIADAGGDNVVPIGDENTVPGSRCIWVRRFHVFYDCVDYRFDFSDSIVLGVAGGDSAKIDSTNDICGPLAHCGQRVVYTGFGRVQD